MNKTTGYRCVHCCAPAGTDHLPSCKELAAPTKEVALLRKALYECRAATNSAKIYGIVHAALAATAHAATVAKEGGPSKLDIDMLIKAAWTEHGRGGATPWTFVREVTRITATPKPDASAATQRARDEVPVPPSLFDFIYSADLYAVLMDAQNSTLSPALPSMANKAIQRLDRLKLSLREPLGWDVKKTPIMFSIAAPISEDTGKGEACGMDMDGTHCDKPGCVMVNCAATSAAPSSSNGTDPQTSLHPARQSNLETAIARLNSEMQDFDQKGSDNADPAK